MKKIFVCIALLLMVFTASAQQKLIDSLKQLLSKATTDTSRVRLLVDLSTKYYLAKPDSGLSYATMALAISRKTGNKRGEMHALTQAGFSIWMLGNRPAALQTFISSLNIAGQLNDKWSIARNYDGMSCVYSEQGDGKTAIEYAFKSEAIFRHLHDYANVVDELMDIEDFYKVVGKLDSSLMFGKKALETSERIKEFTWRSQVLGSLGEVYFRLNNRKPALEYLYRSIAIAKQQKQIYNLIVAYYALATTYHGMGKRDSCIFYAKEMFDLAQSRSFGLQISDASSLLANVYYGYNDHEAAQYYKIATSIKDSLFSAEKAKQVFIIKITEQQHEADLKNAVIAYQNKLKLLGILLALTLVIIILLITWRNNKKQQKANKLLKNQKQQIQDALQELKATQTQLIQSEKMASLGELTAGIAHEIQNPLNFVNNFSEVNAELIDELKEEIAKGNLDEVIAIADDIKANEQKITTHGKRADGIVKGMLEHSRSRSGKKEPTDLNVMADEFMRLSYHGLRSKDKTFNSELITHLNPGLPKIEVVQQDMGRVFLNLFNNAFYAVNQKQKTAGADYKPEVTVTTYAENGHVIIKVKDNGVGIPDAIKDKIMQPFFTTKPTGEGTGLGLSLTYDMVVKGHGGSIDVKSLEGEGSEFIVKLAVG